MRRTPAERRAAREAGREDAEIRRLAAMTEDEARAYVLRQRAYELRRYWFWQDFEKAAWERSKRRWMVPA